VKIVVCVKQVPDTEADIRVRADGKSIDEYNIKFIVNPYDEYALEEAIKLKEAGKADSVIAVSLGSDRVKEALRTAVAMGVDDVMHLKTGSDSMDGLTAAACLADWIRNSECDLVLLGKEAIDDGNMQIGPMLSELLDRPCVSVVTKLTVDGARVTVERECEGGVEVLETGLPCIVTCQKGLNEPRYPSIRGVMMAKKKQIQEIDVHPGGPKTAIVSLEYPRARQGGKLVGEGPEAVTELLRILREAEKLI
jgi:electron transfer flavoprotein beta subunit